MLIVAAIVLGTLAVLAGLAWWANRILPASQMLPGFGRFSSETSRRKALTNVMLFYSWMTVCFLARYVRIALSDYSAHIIRFPNGDDEFILMIWSAVCVLYQLVYLRRMRKTLRSIEF